VVATLYKVIISHVSYAIIIRCDLHFPRMLLCLIKVQEEQSKLNKSVDLAYGIKEIRSPKRDIGGNVSNPDNPVKTFLNNQKKD